MAEDMLPAHTYGYPPTLHERLFFECELVDSTLPETSVQHFCRFVPIFSADKFSPSISLTGTILSNGIKACSSVTELLQHVPQSCLPALEYPSKCRVIAADLVVTQNTASLEHESNVIFTEVTMRQAHDIRMPVNMEVALTHIRITSVRSFGPDIPYNLTLSIDSSGGYFTFSFM